MRTTPLMLAIALGLGLAVPVVEAARAPAVEADAAPTSWIVVFDEPAAAQFRGFSASDARRPKLAPSSAAATGATKYDARSPAARAYVNYLAELRDVRLADIAARLGRGVSPLYVYSHATNGVALRLSAAEAAAVAGVPGVKSVSPDFRRRVQTSTSMNWIGADEVWNGALPGVGAHRGEGVIVGVIDTGINRTHVAFGGAGITNPRGTYYGFCATNAPACNTKLIGLWDFVATGNGIADPTDANGHGTHTASTAAGNAFMTYSGAAPHANIIAYKACPDDSCNGVALIAAIDQAVEDGVDVINYSIGGSQRDPWLGVPIAGYYDDAEAFLAAREAGIVVAAAAGNDGPEPGSLSAPSNAPWVMSVANANDDGNGVPNTDRLNVGSGRGPVVPFGIVKPDVAAPGTSITAAGITGTTSVSTKTGTSMATPHVAGAAALLKSVNPAYTADQIISAITLTARNSVFIASGVVSDPHEQGNGMIDVAKAARAGLYLETAPGAMRASSADPYGTADALNLPTLGDGACFRTCTLTRTLKLMPGAAPANYTVAATMMTAGATITPSIASFTSSAGGTTLSVTVDVDGTNLLNRWAYGWVTLTNTSGDGRPDLRLPLAVYATPFADAITEANLMDGIDHVATGERGFFDIEVGGMVDLPDARFLTTALATPTRTVQNIAADPTNDDPYDSPVGRYSRLITVPTTATATTWRIGATTSAAQPDIDLYLGRDTDNDGQPEAFEELCVSGSSGSEESCEVEVTLTTGANFWVVAQNWSGSGNAVTVDTYALPLTPADTPQLTTTGPGNIPGGTPFAIRVAYDDPTMVDGERRIGAVIVQRSPGDTVVMAPFTIRRQGTASTPYALSPGAARTVVLPAGAAHETLFVDVPPGATQLTFRTQNGTGTVALYAAHAAIADGPIIANAPARNAPGVIVANAAGANQTITLTGGQVQPGRWYLTPVNNGGAVASVDVVATIDAVAAVPTLDRGSYYNPTRGGHGIFLYPSGPDHALLWYTYLQDGTPTWYYAQGTQPGASQVWTGTVYRAAWNGTSRTLEQIGTMVLTPSAAGKLTFSYNIDGFTGAERMDTFLVGCPMHAGAPLDVSAHWYDTVSPGYGYSVQVWPEYEFLATFVYDGIGVPRFLAAERGGAFAAGDPTIVLDQLSGFAPLGTHSAPVRTSVGALTRSYGQSTIASIGTTATFVDGVPGTWSRSADVTRLSDFPQGCD